MVEGWLNKEIPVLIPKIGWSNPLSGEDGFGSAVIGFFEKINGMNCHSAKGCFDHADF